MAKIGFTTDSKAATRAAQQASNRLQAKVSKEMAAMAKAIGNLERKIIADFKILQTNPDGTLVGPRVNLKQAQKLHRSLTQQFEEIYNTQVKNHVKGYPEVAEYVQSNFNDLDIAANFTDVDRRIMGQLSKQSMLGFIDLGNAARTKIEQALYNNIATNAPFESLVGTISAALTGKLDSRGRPLSANATLYANDAVMNFYNSVHLKKGEDAGLEHYLYVGTIMANTRDFCSARVGRVFTKEEINSWTQSWSGKSGPALTHRGGWNCRHHWQAVKPEWVPEDVDEKLEAAYIPPTRKQIQRATEQGGLSWNELDKLQKSQIGKIGKKLSKGTMNTQTKYYQTWNLLDDTTKHKKIAEWAKKGYHIPEDIKWFTGKPGAVPIPAVPTPTIPKIPKVPKPKVKIPTTALDPEQIITGSISSTPGEAAVLEALDTGMTWKQLDSLQKTHISKIGKKMSKGTFSTKTKYVNTWNELSMETQQMKIAQWEAKGIPIHPNLPLKGPGANISNLTTKMAQQKQAAIVVDDALLQPKINLNVWDDLSQDMNKKYNIGSLDKTTYTEKTGTQLFKKVDEELDRLTTEFPQIGKILNSEVTPLKQIQMVESGTVSDSAFASYSDQTKVMRIPGKVSKKQSSLKKVGKAGTENAFSSTDNDFYSLFRHEFGHTLDKGLRDAYDAGLIDWHHQDEWRTIFKSFDKKEWSRMFGSYSSTDKYEGFAEAFKIYTSPKYKAGMLPINIEKYLNKALGGGPVAVKKAVLGEAAKAKIFKSSAHQALYEKEFATYRELKLSKAQLKGVIKVKCPNIMNSARSWQGTTQGYAPSAWKLKAELLEAGENIKFFGSGQAHSKVAMMKEIKKMAGDIPTEEYIRLRAITQEYYERKGIVTKKLFRGTDGSNSGPGFRAKVNDAKKKIDQKDWDGKYVEIKEPSLNGWSTSLDTAEDFGVESGGITVSTDIPIKDVILSDELWPKTSHVGEREWVVLRRTNQKYLLGDIKSGYKDYQIDSTLTAKTTKYQAELASWKQAIGESVGSKDEIQSGILQYVKNNVPNFEDNIGLIKMKLEKKVTGINLAIHNKQPIKLLGARVPEKYYDELTDSLEQMYMVFDEVDSGHFAGWKHALKENDLSVFWGT